MSMMDQQKMYILVTTSKIFYVHDGSTKIITIGRDKTTHPMSMMDEQKIVFICKNITKHFMFMMDQRKVYILAKTIANILCP